MRLGHLGPARPARRRVAAAARGGAAPSLDRRVVVHRARRRRGRGRGPAGGRHRGDGQRVQDGRGDVHARPATTRSARASCCGSAARPCGVPYAARVETDDDPLVMYLVVRRRTTRPFAELATAAALATRRCAHRYRDDDRWRDGFDDWWRHSFRKVCLRAEPREWEDVRALDHERVGDVACLPPVRRSARDRVLVRMQALSDEAGPLPELDDPVARRADARRRDRPRHERRQDARPDRPRGPDGRPRSRARPGLASPVPAASEWAALAALGGRRRPGRRPDRDRAGLGDGARARARTACRVEDGGVTRVLIVNPFASGVTERKLAAVQAALPAGTETVLTQARGEATELAAEWSPRAEAIYVFSGDGTYNEVINGLRADIPVGFVPGGGTSVLPRALGLPRDPARAAERIAHGKPRRISLGRINGRRFAFNAGIGFDAELVRRVDGLGRRAGRQAARRPRLRLDRRADAVGAPASLRAGARGRGARARRVRARRELLAVHLRRAPRPAVRARRLLRGRAGHRRAGRGARPGDPAPRRAGAPRAARRAATCSSATTSTGS